MLTTLVPNAVLMPGVTIVGEEPKEATMSTTYPVHVNAELDPRLSRWLWLVKWVLVLPHYIVLAFLWVAFVVLSVIAFFGILLTGRYPRSVFEFNVGVLRWSWRVAYYAYGALATDRYPPFTLHDVADYPAHLDVEYPDHLSRGLVLVKWWLLAIPHYIVVGLLVGGAGFAVRAGRDQPAVWSAGLIGLLVVVAGVMLLFTGRYPQQLFDLVLGLNRWVLRVAGYASLMTDRYPPFSLDQGGLEGGGGSGSLALPHTPTPSPPTPSPTHSPTGPHQDPRSPRPSAWTAGRVVSLTLGCLMMMLSLVLGVPAGALAAAGLGARDDSGFLMSGPQPLGTSTYALVSSNVELHVDAPPDLTPAALLGDAQLTVEPRGGGAVFIGLAPTAEVEAYLGDVERSVLIDLRNGRAVLAQDGRAAPATAPGRQDIWVAQSSGSGPQSIRWTPENGDWTVVVMNADGSAGVSVDASAGAEVPAMWWVIGILVLLAALSLLVGIVLVAVPLRSVSKQNAGW